MMDPKICGGAVPVIHILMSYNSNQSCIGKKFFVVSALKVDGMFLTLFTKRLLEQNDVNSEKMIT